MLTRSFLPKSLKIAVILIPAFCLLGFSLPQNMIIPVAGASKADWNPESFWYYPWGKSVTHKGIDIFAEEGRDVIASTNGIVLYTGNNGRGGLVTLILGPKWRIHYYAHLQSASVEPFGRVTQGQQIGKVGRSGNAANTPAHLHYTIVSLVPYFWKIDTSPQGWKKMFYLDPLYYLPSGS